MEATYEHERRFLVAEPQILQGHEGYWIRQAYLWSAGGYAVRVRRTQARDEDGSIYDTPAMFTLKGPKSDEGRRLERELDLPVEDALAIIAVADHVVTKHRFVIVSENNTFEVDEFSGANEGLYIAEFEASEEQVALLKKPWWCGPEITRDHRYNNENLALRPWTTWPENQG